ncbi:MAG: hypothetical protein E7675_07710 [Ruminococcaceae bacterium]|nr:hypothetical protein [Oscillospiraceae bacterium]
MKKNNSKKSRISKKTVLVLALVAVALASVTFAMFFIFGGGNPSSDNIIYYYTTEAGTPVSPSVFVTDSSLHAKFADDVDIENLVLEVGEHPIKILVDGMTYNVKLNVEDTVPPTASPMNILCRLDSVPVAADMVQNIKDVTKVKVSFERSPNMSVKGRQNVSIKLTDEGGNTTVINSLVYVEEVLNIPEWELGTAFPDISDFTGGISSFTFLDNSFINDIKHPGDYKIPLKISYSDSFETYYAKFKAKDTVAPKVTPITGGVYDINEELPAPEDWIAEFVDATEVTFSYAYDYSITTAGIYNLEIVAKDEGFNVATIVVKVTAFDSKHDNTAPIITVPKDLVIRVGQTVNFKECIKIFDDKDGELDISNTQKVSVDTSTLNIYLPGTYNIFITATDSTGKSSSATLSVKVEHADLSSSEINSVLDKIIEEATEAGMTREQRIYAIFNKILKNENMNFNGTSDKNNTPEREAYYGFVNNYGDSFTVACMTKAVLERMGYDVITVQRISTTEKYYWSLVDFGDGWFHVDPFYKKEIWVVNGSEKETFKLTDRQLSEYTLWYDSIKSGVNYYLFDPLLYPSTPELVDDGYVYNPYRVVYITSEGGYIDGKTDQSIAHGHSSSTVTAVAASGYKFIGWSDGVKTAERKDVVKSDLTVTALFEKDSQGLFKKYKIKYIAATGGKILGSASQYVDSGFYSTPVFAVPESGYKFVGWSDGVLTEERQDLAKSDLTVIANFALYEGTTYTFEYKSGLGGSVSGKTFQILEENETATAVVAIPAEGYVFNCWSDGVLTAERLDIANKNISVTAYFAKEGSTIYNIIYKPSVGGIVEGYLNQRIEAGMAGEKVVAIPDRGYKFVSWSDGLVNTERQDIATKDSTFTAIFEALNEYRIIYMISGEGGYISGQTTQHVFEGESASTVVAHALEGYKFIGWSDGVTTPERTDVPKSSIEVTAIFEKLPTFGVTYLTSEGGIISGKSDQTVIIDCYTEKVTAVALRGFKFVSWSDGITTAERSDLVTEDISVTAIFEALNEYTVNYLPTIGGKITGTLTQTLFEGEIFETVVAVPDDGYEFVSWSDGVTTPERTDTATMNADITANFVPKRICTVIYNPTVGGKIEGALTQTIFIGSSTTTVTAVAEEGYYFLYWDDGVTEATRSDIAKESLIVYTAIFAPIPPEE